MDPSETLTFETFGKADAPYRINDAKKAYADGNIDGLNRYLAKYFVRTAKMYVHLPYGGAEDGDRFEILKPQEMGGMLPDVLNGEGKKVEVFPKTVKLFPMVRMKLDPTKSSIWYENKYIHINMFRGWKHEDFKANEEMNDSEMSHSEMKMIEPWLRVLKECWANNNEEIYKYLLRWFARIAQKKKNETIIFGSTPEQGAGKGAIIRFLQQEVFGKNAVVELASAKTITGDFNYELAGRVLGVLNEMPCAGPDEYHALSNSIKHLADGHTLELRRKYHDVKYVDNFLNLIVFSQFDKALKLEAYDRRICVLDFSSHRVGDQAYWDKVHASFTPEAGKALWKYLQKFDLGGHKDLYPPMTRTKALSSMSRAARFVKETFLIVGDGLPLTPAKTMYGLFEQWSKRSFKGAVQNQMQFKRDLEHIGIKIARVRGKAEGDQKASELWVTQHFLEMSRDSLAELYDKLGYIDDTDEIPVPGGGMKKGATPALRAGPQIVKQLAAHPTIKFSVDMKQCGDVPAPGIEIDITCNLPWLRLTEAQIQQMARILDQDAEPAAATTSEGGSGGQPALPAPVPRKKPEHKAPPPKATGASGAKPPAAPKPAPKSAATPAPKPVPASTPAPAPKPTGLKLLGGAKQAPAAASAELPAEWTFDEKSFDDVKVQQAW